MAGKATPPEWPETGQTIAAHRVPTRYGTVGYSVTSRRDAQRIDAQIDLELHSERQPSAIQLRVRTPGERKIRAAEIDGSPWTRFDTDREVVTLANSSGRHVVIVHYAGR